MPDEISSTPWQVVFTYRSANGSQTDGRSPVLTPDQHPDYTLQLPAATDALVTAEVQQYGPPPQANTETGEIEFPIRASWVLTRGLTQDRSGPTQVATPVRLDATRRDVAPKCARARRLAVRGVAEGQPSRSRATARTVGGELGRAALGVAAAAQVGLHARLQQPDHVLDEAVQILGRTPGRLDRGRRRLQQPHLQRLRPPPALRHAELDALAGFERLDPVRQCIATDVDVLSAVLGKEPEALVRVEPLDPAGRHASSPVLYSRRTRPRATPGTRRSVTLLRDTPNRSRMQAARPG